MRTQPKKNITKINSNNSVFGNEVRLGYQKAILEKAPNLPKPLEYDDIDKAVFEFVDKKIDLTIDGKTVPTYTLYSNQRFSEYTQMWEHSDENGNLYLNFKTINRDKDPSFGDNQGSLWNIPGNRKYTLMKRDIIDENGVECTEIYSMSQPYAVDLTYTINFITVTLEELNNFNQKVNKLFSARQYYIRPNGHFIPMVIDDISDETTYSISDRKFFVQSITIKLMAYIIEKNDFEVKRYPKNINISFENLKASKQNCVDVEEEDSPMKNKTLNVNIQMKPYKNKVEFDFDTNMKVEEIITENVRTIRVMVNGVLYYTDKGFVLRDEDNVRIQIRPFNESKESFIKFVGYEIDSFYNSEVIPEKVFDDPVTHEDVIIE